MSFCWSKIRPEEALRPIAVAKWEPFALAPVVFKKEESMADQDERSTADRALSIGRLRAAATRSDTWAPVLRHAFGVLPAVRY